MASSASAEKLIYGDKKDQIDALLDHAAARNKEKDGENAPVKQKEFYWDQIVIVLVSSMLGLSFLEISIEFFRGSEVQCYFNNNFTISKGNYINSYCYGSLPNTQYYLVFILISALVLFAPQYLWNSYFSAHFDFFFDLIKKLNRLRDTNTGEYSPQNFERVKKLEERFSKSQIFFFYKAKLVLQWITCVIVLVVNAVYFKEKDFEEEFDCLCSRWQLSPLPTAPIYGHLTSSVCLQRMYVLNVQWYYSPVLLQLLSPTFSFTSLKKVLHPNIVI